MNDIPEDNIVSLQDYIIQLEDSIELLNALPTYEVSDYAEGGIVFYVEEGEEGKYGLVAAMENQGPTNWNDAKIVCENYVFLEHDDWYLPSLEELSLMYNTIGQGSENIGDFSETWYWSSSLNNENSVWNVNFGDDGNTTTDNLVGQDLFRPIRAFGNWTMGCMDSHQL